MKHACINGWTKEKMIEHVLCEFQGRSTDNSDSTNNCLYKGPNGTKCAVGMFIPDNVYDKDMDTKDLNSIQCIAEKFPKLNEHMPLKLEALSRMQLAHDFPVSKHATPTDEETFNSIVNWIYENVAD